MNSETREFMHLLCNLYWRFFGVVWGHVVLVFYGLIIGWYLIAPIVNSMLFTPIPHAS